MKHIDCSSGSFILFGDVDVIFLRHSHVMRNSLALHGMFSEYCRSLYSMHFLFDPLYIVMP